MKIVCVGHACYETTLLLEEYPLENSKNKVIKKVECGGGSSNNAAFSLGVWGWGPYFIGSLGDDLAGKKVKEELETVGVLTDYLSIKKEYPTDTSVVCVNQKNGSRTVLTSSSLPKMTPFSLPFAPDFLLFDGSEPDLVKSLLTEFPGMISVMDAGKVTEEMLLLASLSTYLVCSKKFAEEVTGISLDRLEEENLKACYQKMKQRFSNVVVITVEEQGCLYEKAGTFVQLPTIPVTVVDTTGAGDVFHAAFLYGLKEHWALEEILAFANQTATLSTTKLSCHQAIPSLEEIGRG